MGRSLWKKIGKIGIFLPFLLISCSLSKNNSDIDKYSSVITQQLVYEQSDGFCYFCNIDYQNMGKLNYYKVKGGEKTIISVVPFGKYKVIYDSGRHTDQTLYIYNTEFYLWKSGLN